MKKLLGLAAGLTLAAVAAPGLAQAQNAYTSEFVNLRAGPGLEYPVVFEVAQGQPLESYGCLDGYGWCDVSVNGYRGWIAGEFIEYADGGGYEPLYAYGPRYHVPIISFSFVTYWDTHYRNYGWYRDRDRWAHYDWRSRRWDDDRWRQWAHNNRNDHDRHDWNGRVDRDGRDGRNGGWNGRNDRDGRDGRNGGWNGRNDNDRDGRNGNFNDRTDRTDNNGRDNDRRPGAPVRGTAKSGVGQNGGGDPSVHSGTTANYGDGNRFGNPKRWGGNSYKPDSVNYGNRNPRVDAPRQITPRVEAPNPRNGDRTPKVNRTDNNQANTKVSPPRGNDRVTVQPNNGGQSGKNADRQNDRKNDRNDRKNDRRDGNDGRS